MLVAFTGRRRWFAPLMLAMMMAAQQPLAERATASQLPASAPSELEAAYLRFLDTPPELLETFERARNAEERGLDAQAIRLYEGMLRGDGGLSRVRLRLAVLAMKSERPDLAREQLGQALADDRLPPAIQDTAAQLLARLDAKLSRHKFAGQGRFGVGVAANPRALSNLLDRVDAFRDTDIRKLREKRSDRSVFASLDFQHSYDFHGQQKRQLETELYLFSEKYVYDERYRRSSKNVDLLFAEVTSGPRVGLGAKPLAKASVRPFVLARATNRDPSLLSSEIGGGLELKHQLSRSTSGRVSFESVQESRSRRVAGAAQRFRQGRRSLGEARLKTKLSPSHTSEVKASFKHDGAVRNTMSVNAVEGSIGLSSRFHPLFGVTDKDWTTAVGASYRHTTYGSEAGRALAGVENRLRGRLSTSIPLGRKLALEARFSHSVVASSARRRGDGDTQARFSLVFR
ncbi:MAG: tetratricopeptide repeat protein [Geminicoccaceae bacterium]